MAAGAMSSIVARRLVPAGAAPPSPNHGARPAGAVVDLIVVHSISLPPGEYGGNQVQGCSPTALTGTPTPYFQQIHGLEVSSHFFITRLGQLWQFVATDRRAWHAGDPTTVGAMAAMTTRSALSSRGRGPHLRRGTVRRLDPAVRGAGAAPPHRLCRRPRTYRPGRKNDPGPGLTGATCARPLRGRASCFRLRHSQPDGPLQRRSPACAHLCCTPRLPKPQPPGVAPLVRFLTAF